MGADPPAGMAGGPHDRPRGESAVRVYVGLYSTYNPGHNHVFTIESPSAQKAVALVPKCLERHLQAAHDHCPLDHWTVWTVHRSTQLPRIQAKGAIRDGTTVPDDGPHDRLAD